MPRPSTNRSTVPRRDGEPDQGMSARSVGRPHLDRDNGRQPAAAVVLVVRLRAARGLAPDRSAATPSWRKPPAAASARSCSNSAPASPSPSGASRSPSPRPARTTPSSPRRMPGCAHRRGRKPHAVERMTPTAAVAPVDSLWLRTTKTRRYIAKPTSPRQRRVRTQLHAPPDLTPRPPRYPRFGEISGFSCP